MDKTGSSHRAVAALFSGDAEADAAMDGEMDVDTRIDVLLGKRFLLDLGADAAAKYKEYLKEQLLKGEGETVVEIGTAIDTIEDEKGGWNCLNKILIMRIIESFLNSFTWKSG